MNVGRNGLHLGELNARRAEAWTRLRSDSLLRNSAFIMATTITTSALGYGYWLLAARLTTAASVGAAAAMISALTLASLIANLGAYSAIVYRLPQQATTVDWSRTLCSALAVSGTTSAAIAAIVAGSLWFLGRHGHTYTGAAAALVFVLCAVMTTVSQIFDYAWLAQRKAHVMFGLNALFAVGKLVLLVVLAGDGTFGVIAAWTLGVCFAVTASLFLLVTRSGFRPVVRGLFREANAMRELLVGHHAINLGGVVPLYLIPVLVGLRGSPAETAHFFAAWRVGTFFVVFAAAVSASLYAEGSNDPTEIRSQARAAIRMVAAALLPIVALVIGCGHILLGFFGSGYSRTAYWLLVLMALSAISDVVPTIYGAVFRVEGRLSYLVRINWATAFLQLAGAWLLLPSLGVTGPGVAWVSAEAIGAAIVVREIRRSARVPQVASAGPDAPTDSSDPEPV